MFISKLSIYRIDYISTEKIEMQKDRCLFLGKITVTVNFLVFKRKIIQLKINQMTFYEFYHMYYIKRMKYLKHKKLIDNVILRSQFANSLWFSDNQSFYYRWFYQLKHTFIDCLNNVLFNTIILSNKADLTTLLII